MGPTDWSFKCIKAKDSIWVHPAKVVLLVNNIICCFNTPFFLSTSIAICGLKGRWNLHSMSCSVARSCTSWLLKCDLRSLSFPQAYLYMVPSFSNPLMVAAWFTWQQGKAWVRPDAASTQTKAYLELSLRGRGTIESIWQSLTGWELWWMASGSFSSCFGCCLEHTGHAFTVLTKYFRGHLASLAICHFLRHCGGHSF